MGNGQFEMVQMVAEMVAESDGSDGCRIRWFRWLLRWCVIYLHHSFLGLGWSFLNAANPVAEDFSDLPVAIRFAQDFSWLVALIMSPFLFHFQM